MTEQEKALKLLTLSPHQLRERMDGIDTVSPHLRMAVSQEVIDLLDAIAQRAALYAEYLGQRTGSSRCGDKADHETAARVAQKKCVKVRKALGFTVPEAGLGNFGW